ncbi:MAG: nucleotide sugar dehydrogenase [Gammaproteobacteria bacterium]|nr:nucleotide sugar dehydrogenase [Gammaproteobacteria bacterium]MYF59519.1 nucleotide sugar dehydrogenase [Gammaproteobacteria bacterium]
MKITVHGCGYVGLVTGACFAETGVSVICLDIDSTAVERLRKGDLHIHEPGLEDLVRRNLDSGRLMFSADVREGVEHGEVQFIAVSTPPGGNGEADLRQVFAVAGSIAAHMPGYRLVACKSTVPVGTCAEADKRIAAALAERAVNHEYDVVSNPEFLKGGAAVSDFMHPERILVGTKSQRAIEILSALFAPFHRKRDRLLVMDRESAELTKYAANAMLATRISFINELAGLAELVGADIEQVRAGVGADKRIGYNYLYAGSGYGGSCLPKDTAALARTARENGYRAEIVEAVTRVNERQKSLLGQKIQAHFGDTLAGRLIALWGLSFKPGTDDMREAPSLALIEFLLSQGARVRAYDPVAVERCNSLLGEREGLEYAPSAGEAVRGADALAIVTEWPQFRSPDFDKLRERLRQPVIFDGRNLYSPDVMKNKGFRYFGIGRGERIARDNGSGVHPVGEEVFRPWGSFEGLGQGEGYQVKRLRVLPGETLSLQRHRRREEHWVVVSGAPVAERDGESHSLRIGDHILIPLGAVHRIHNPGDEPAELVEVQLGDYLGEDDIERFEDAYGRA